MKLHVTKRPPGDIPIGALAMLPVLWVPLGLWMLENSAAARPGCFTKLMWNVPCLTCGGTRATRALAHGNLLEAIAFQPLIIFGYGFLLVWGLISLWALLTKRRLVLDLTRRQDLALKGVIIGAPVLNWVYIWTMGI